MLVGRPFEHIWVVSQADYAAGAQAAERGGILTSRCFRGALNRRARRVGAQFSPAPDCPSLISWSTSAIRRSLTLYDRSVKPHHTANICRAHRGLLQGYRRHFYLNEGTPQLFAPLCDSDVKSRKIRRIILADRYHLFLYYNTL